MSIREEERTIQRRLSYLTGGLIVATPFLTLAPQDGRLAYTALACAGGVLLVKGIRALSKRNQIKAESKDKSRTNEVAASQNYGIPESPGTAIARRSSELGRDTLETVARNFMYSEMAKEAGRTAEQYLTQMREINPDRIARSSGISVSFEDNRNSGLRRLLFGKREEGYELNISLVDKSNEI